MDAVGSNARPGSAVLIVNELSMTSVSDAVRAVAPFATSTDAATSAAASDTTSAARLLGGVFTAVAPLSGVGYTGVTRLLHVDGGDKSGAVCRRGRVRALGLQPAGGGAAVGQRHERRLLDRAASERVRAARMEAAAARRLCRVGHLAGKRVGQEAAPVGM